MLMRASSLLISLSKTISRTASVSHDIIFQSSIATYQDLYAVTNFLPDSRSVMSFLTVSVNSPLPCTVLQQITSAGPLNEISNIAGAVRHHIFSHGHRHKSTGRLEASMLFFVYQTTRHGPQNGFRLCLVHRGYHVASASASKVEGDPEDDIDRLERPIPQGHMEVVILGDVPPASDNEDEDQANEDNN